MVWQGSDTTENASMKVLIADDHEVIRAGVKQWLKGWTVFEAVHAHEVIKLYRKHRPDVVVIETRLPGDGLDCLARLKSDYADSQVLMFSRDDNPTYLARSVALGARGYLSKRTTSKQFLSALKTVADGGDVWTQDTLHHTSEANIPQLTKRENDVLKQLALGLNNREIGKALGISYETVKEHVQHILRKLQVEDRTRAAVWAVQQELV